MTNDSPVTEHLERAIEAAQEQGMSASEIIGLLFYYAHNIAQEAREAALREGGASTGSHTGPGAS